MARETKLKPRKKPRQQRSRRTVDAILEAAAQVFEAQGYARGTTDRIAQRAGVSVGSLYQYFPNKDAILVALAQQHTDHGLLLARGMLASAPATAEGAEPWLRRLIQGLLAMHRHQPRLQHMLLEGLPLPQDTHDRMVAAEAELQAAVEAVLLRWAPPGTLQRPRVTAWMMLHTLQALVHDYAIHPPADIDEGALEDELVEMLRSWIGF
jgi:AcrR family transcriptional regulator